MQKSWKPSNTWHAKQAGTPHDLAEKFEISERTVQRMVQHLRDAGCAISFNRNRRTYEILDSK
jgi:predicted DNA-binding transcriptional regulator YafY